MPATLRKLPLILIFAGILAGLFFILAQPFEPRYAGKKLSRWTIIYLNWTNSPATHLRAENAIHQIGIRALPYAVKWGKATRTHFWVLEHDGSLHRVTPEDLHQRSMVIFSVLGPEASPAIPKLMKLLRDKNRGVVNTAMENLSAIGPDAVPPLMAALAGKDTRLRENAATLLGGLPVPASAVLKLTPYLKDPDSMVRAGAAKAIGHSGTNLAVSVLPALIGALNQETNRITATFLISAIGNFGTNSSAAVPALRAILEAQPATPVLRQPQRAALSVLQRIDPVAAKPFMEKWNVSPVN